jgi:histidyl-tRNA synthetase
MKPQLVQGTRDFSPSEVLKRQYIFDTLRKIFIKFGYMPLETPAMEALETLTGKYGDEGDQLLFKILNNGLDQPEKQERARSEFEELLKGKNVKGISERALRYDLTVPFARYVVMNRNDIAFPFKRYQIQPVWRGDKPQRGRYREFFQCDIDVIGSDALLYEAELIQIYDEAFKALNIEVVIRLNNRKVLEGLAIEAGYPDKFMDITIAIDKLDKIGWDGVKKEMENKGIGEKGFETIKNIVSTEKIDALKLLFSDNNVIAKKGVEELESVLSYLDSYTFKNKIQLDFTLARGLSYYTGCIFEVVTDTKAPGQESVKMGSIGGGGRYDNLTGVFGWEGNSGVGVSFGADRIYDVLLQLDRFDAVPENTTELFFMAFDEAAHRYAFKIVQQCREAGINTDIYPESAKFQKQMKYADKRKFSTVVIIGENEMESGLLTVKNMLSGEQQGMTISEIIEKFGKKL